MMIILQITREVVNIIQEHLSSEVSMGCGLNNGLVAEKSGQHLVAK